MIKNLAATDVEMVSGGSLCDGLILGVAIAAVALGQAYRRGVFNKAAKAGIAAGVYTGANAVVMAIVNEDDAVDAANKVASAAALGVLGGIVKEVAFNSL